MADWQNDLEGKASLSQAVLAQLREDMGDDVQEVIDAFVAAIDELMVDLKNRDSAEDAETTARLAHSIKSSAASIGMMRLSAIAAGLEKWQKQGVSIDVDAQVLAMENEYRASRQLLEQN